MEEKKRSSNFNALEVELLIKLVLKNKSVVECKKTDRYHWNEKNNVWKNIEKEFNAESGQTFRSVNVLRKKYENIKKLTKKKFSQRNKSIYLADKSENVIINSIDETVYELLGEQVKEGLPNLNTVPNRTDKNYESSDDKICDFITDHPTLDSFDESKEESNSNSDNKLKGKANACNNFIPNQLSSRSPTPLRTKKKKIKTIKPQQLDEEKLKLIKEKRKYIKEKHILEIKHMKEEHEQKMQFLKMQNYLKTKILEEELQTIQHTKN